MQPQLKQKIDEMVASNDVVLFMKGNKSFPQCGFSATVVQILGDLVSDFTTVNVLADPEIRNGIKEYSDWPTIPQLYIRGEFVGGCDIVKAMYAAGELQEKLGVQEEPVSQPEITVTDSAKAQFLEALKEADSGSVIHFAVSSNYDYGLEIGSPNTGAFTIDAGGLTLQIDKSSAKRANGIVIDFKTEGEQQGFKIENPNEPPSVKQITPGELKAKLDAGEISEFYDVRGLDEIAIVNIGAKHLDDKAMDRIETLAKDTPIAFHCHHGGRSQRAAEHFLEKGFHNVYNVAGGIDAWAQTVDTSLRRY